MQEMWVPSLGREDPLEKEMATHSSILAWRIPWTEEPGGLQSMGSQSVRYHLATKQPPPNILMTLSLMLYEHLKKIFPLTWVFMDFFHLWFEVFILEFMNIFC